MRSVVSVFGLSVCLLAGLAACDSGIDPRFEPAEDCGPPGTVTVDTLEKGNSPSTVRSTSQVIVDYVGTYPVSRDTFDAGGVRSFNLGGGVIAGFTRGLTGTVVGDSVRLLVPPNLGYGGRDYPPGSPNPIPACSDLQFHVRVLDIVG